MAQYINNAEFLAAIKEYKKAIKEAEEKGLEKPQIPNFLGECVMKIAQHLSYKPNFINYTYKDDMILDGIENCVNYFDNFDPDKSSNPFAYFTQIIYFAFLRRIQKEKKHSYIKHKMIQDMPFDSFDIQAHDEDGNYHNAYLDFMQSNGNFDPSTFDSFTKKEKKSKKKEQPSLDEFINEPIENTDITNTDEQ